MLQYTYVLDCISKMVSMKIFYTTFMTFMLYNLPIILFCNLFLVTRSIAGISVTTLFNFFYRSPMYIMLYFYTTNSLFKNLQHHRTTVPPNPLFLNAIIVTNYAFIYLVGCLLPYNVKLLTNTTISALCISQLSYNFIDNAPYDFKNSISFFNSNIPFFLIIGGIYNIIEFYYLSLYNLEIVGFYLYILACFPLLTRYTYSTSPSAINIFYFAELVWGSISQYYSLN